MRFFGIILCSFVFSTLAFAVKPPELPSNPKAWVNSKPLQLKDLKGQVVLLEFFSGESLNGAYVVPQLTRWPKIPLKVIGIYSFKRSDITDVAAIQKSLTSLGFSYPTILDNDFSLRNAYDPNSSKNTPFTVLMDDKGELQKSDAVMKEVQGLKAFVQAFATTTEKKDYMADNYVKPTDSELKKNLTAEQFEVTQKEGTERPFQNQYWNNHEAGIYVDIVSGEPLFSSIDKYDSGTGWPSFSAPLVKENVVTRTDKNLYLGDRTEVRSKKGDSHLGHVFDDGPGPAHQRFCMNSASLRFIKVSDLDKEGYAQYLSLFKK